MKTKYLALVVTVGALGCRQEKAPVAQPDIYTETITIDLSMDAAKCRSELIRDDPEHYVQSHPFCLGMAVQMANYYIAEHPKEGNP